MEFLFVDEGGFFFSLLELVVVKVFAGFGGLILNPLLEILNVGEPLSLGFVLQLMHC